MKKRELQRLIEDIVNDKTKLESLDDDVKEKLLKYAIRRTRTMMVHSWLRTFKDLFYVAAVITILILVYRLYLIFHGHFN